MSWILKRMLIVGLTFALLISSVGLPSTAQLASAKPEDFIPLEITAGTLGAIAVPLLSAGIGSFVCFQEDIESCGDNRVKRPFLVVPVVMTVLGPGLGAAIGVIWAGSSLGVHGNIMMAFMGGLLGEGVSLLTGGVLYSSYIQPESEETQLESNPSGLAGAAVVALVSWLFVAPALGATWGYNLSSEMTSAEGQLPDATGSNSVIEASFTLFELEF